MDQELDKISLDFEEISYEDEIYYDTQNWPELTAADTFEPSNSREKQEDDPLKFPIEPTEFVASIEVNNKGKKRQRAPSTKVRKKVAEGTNNSVAQKSSTASTNTKKRRVGGKLSAATEELRRQRKNNREKERRHEVNDRFETLMTLLGLKCQADKARILQKAIEQIQGMTRQIELYKVSVTKMKYENETLRTFAKEYVYNVAKPVAEHLKNSNSNMATSETKAQLKKLFEPELQKKEREYLANNRNRTSRGGASSSKR